MTVAAVCQLILLMLLNQSVGVVGSLPIMLHNRTTMEKNIRCISELTVKISDMSRQYHGRESVKDDIINIMKDFHKLIF